MSYVHPEAIIGENVEIGPFVYIDKDVEIGDGCQLAPNVTILEGTKIGKNCKIASNAVIGGLPQDLKFRGEKTTVVIGDNTTIRECATVNRGTAAKGSTIVGNNCLLMAYTHVAHDCVLGDFVILANATQLAGEVEVEDYAILGGGTLVHQFCRIGAHSMTQGGSKVSKDIPPYVTAAREPLSFVGVNAIGLRRRNFTNEQIELIQEVYRYIFQSKLNTTHAIAEVLENMEPSAERELIVDFIQASPRGIIKGFN